MNVPHGRVPPHNADAESSLLGGLLLDPSRFDDVCEHLSAGDFYRAVNRNVYEAMLALAGDGEPIDRPLVKARMASAGTLNPDAEAHVDLLDQTVPIAANLGHYAKVIADKALARRLIEAGSAIAQLGYDAHGEARELADECERRILAATETDMKGDGPVSIRKVMGETYQQIQRNNERGEAITGLPTGLKDLDAKTAGWQPKDLIVLAARPSVGKTACSLGWAAHAAIDVKQPVLFFSLEMAKVQLGERLLSRQSRVDGQRIRTGALLESDWAKMANATGIIAESPMEIDDGRGLSVLEIRTRARRSAKRFSALGKKLALIVVDYLSLLRTEDGDATESKKVGRNTQRLKELAGELSVPLVLLAQLNRENVKGSKPRRPIMSDLRDSGEIEQHADVIVFIHVEQGDDGQPRHELILEKQRNGPVGIVPVSFQPDISRFSDLAHGGAAPHWTEGQ